jgi:hypothetical protein
MSLRTLVKTSVYWEACDRDLKIVGKCRAFIVYREIIILDYNPS